MNDFMTCRQCYREGFQIGSVPPVGLAHPMRTIADRSILGIRNSESIDETVEDKFIYGGGGEVGLQLLISVADFCRLSDAVIVDIGSSSVETTADSVAEDLSSTSKISTDHSENIEIVTSTKSRRERLTSQLSNADAALQGAAFTYQPSVRKVKNYEDSDKVTTSSMKSIRKERWLTAISSTGLPNFSAKLLRDYSMLLDSNPFFEMLSLYDASPASFQAGLSR